MTVSTNNYINTALIQSIAQNKNFAIDAVKEELSALPTVGDKLVTARKYDILELSAEYKTEAASKAESISEDKPLSEAERLYTVELTEDELELAHEQYRQQYADVATMKFKKNALMYHCLMFQVKMK